MSRGARLAAYGAVSTSLALCGDRRLRDLVDAAEPLGSGIGGRSVLLEVEGTPVFVKQVRLTDVERRPRNIRSTANLFGLPVFCQYGIGGIGSPGFGAWRELAAHTMTSDWVVAGDHEGFPLMYHWRVLPDAGRPLPGELADVERAVAYWGGGAGVRRRVEALRDSSASLTLFLEYLPHNLHEWLNTQVEAGGEAAERACAMVESELDAGLSFMNARGLVHFDAHFQNILTDGRRLFLTDFGLATSSRFELAQDEREFLDTHREYDRRYAFTHLVNWLAVALFGYEPEERRAFVHACAQGVAPPPGVPAGVAAALLRHAPIATAMGDFSRRFVREGRSTRWRAR
ncbi:protein kinase family protein [Streptomyces edwardsiae]|uniref:Protein kinase family protein n=1 Tax=Streptomyces edwardsiae TaxID=3075527 RepID=A0ABU2Q1L0_9ACTN|nr:protein kinase family protein [Streptomyces sp. DSM 41636]MDT0398305.1 protein kinase family protein [Streptomyces sp. DSM 41636]